MIKKAPLCIVFLSLCVLMLSCTNQKKYRIAKGSVGLIHDQTTISELDAIFKNDSIVKYLSEGALGDDYFQDNDQYLIYEKGGKHLLTIVPKEQLDATSTIKNVEIFDERYKTSSGLAINSKFADLKEQVKVNKIESTFTSVTLFIDELNATVTIANEELGLKNFSSQKIHIDQIPDLAKIKSLVIWFN